MIKKRLLGMGAVLAMTTALAGFAIGQEPTPSPTVSPEPSPTVSPSPTETPSPSPMPSPTVSPMPSPTMSPTPKPETVAQNISQEVVEQPMQAQDDRWTVIEYPEGKEVMVALTPYQIPDAKGWARVVRTSDGTTVALDLSGIPADTKNYYVYAVDQTGAVTLLGPATIENGMSKVSYTTPMSKFMLFLSPTEGLTAYDKATAVSFRSAAPKGYAIVPLSQVTASGDTKEKQTAVSEEVASTYEVPLLGVPSFKEGTTEVRVKFAGDLQGLKGKAYIDARKDGSARIKMRFDDMKMAPKDKRFVLWAVSPEKEYIKIGQVINTGERQEGEVRGETALKDFGLFVTVEETDVTTPTSKVYSPVVVGQIQ